MAEIETQQAEVVAQKRKQVGDENVADVREPEVEVNTEAVDAQVAPAREKDAAKVPVHETKVATDVVVTDPSSPEAVQVPDAGRGSLDLPIHQLAEGTVESRFESEASEADESKKDETPSS